MSTQSHHGRHFIRHAVDQIVRVDSDPEPLVTQAMVSRP